MYCASAEARGAICRRNRHAARISSSLVLADTDLDSAPVKAGEILILIAAASAGEVDLVRGWIRSEVDCEAIAPFPRPTGLRSAFLDGYSLHADRLVDPDDRGEAPDRG